MAAECTGLADIVSALATSQLGCFGVGRWNDGLVLYCVVRCLLLFIMCVLDSRDMWRSIVFPSSQVHVYRGHQSRVRDASARRQHRCCCRVIPAGSCYTEKLAELGLCVGV